MARIPKVHEPFAVDAPRHLLQQPDATVVVLDEVVICGENGGNLALYWEWWQYDRESLQDPQVDAGNCRPNCTISDMFHHCG